METKKRTSRVFKNTARLGITLRLALFFTLYTAGVLLFVTALVYAPFLALAGAFLTAIAVDFKKKRDRRGAQPEVWQMQRVTADKPDSYTSFARMPHKAA